MFPGRCNLPRFAIGFALLMLPALGCQRPTAPAAAPAAEKPKVESELGRTTLSLEAGKSLGIRSDSVRKQLVQEHRQLTGWVTVKQGNEVTVTAPVAGYVREPAAPAGLPVPGLAVQKAQELLRLDPVLSPLEQVQLASLKRGIENEVAKARESITVAESELRRVQSLHEQKLRGQQDVEQAQARLNLAKADLDSAVDKGKLFAVSAKGNGMAQLPTLSLEAPRAGTLLMAHVSPGQYVQAAAPLVTLADLSQLWVRVPIPEHDLPHVDRKKPATVALKTAGPRTKGRKDQAQPNAERTFPAQLVALVPQVDLARHTADLIYELPAASQKVLFAKDQMATVFVPLGKETEQTVVSYSALIFDAYGGTWIYLDKTPEKATELVFERRRVELGPTVEGGVVVRPAFMGTERVVVAGAAALFSREFHKPPVKVGEMSTVDDDDD